MPRQRQREPGRVVQVPLGDGSVGWGRQLRGVHVEFYDRFDTDANAKALDASAVVGSEVAFTVAVMDYAFRRSSNWTLLDVVPLSDPEAAATYRSFIQDPISGELSIHSQAPDGSWAEDPATRPECIGLERSAVWDPEHIEDRLRDFRAGRPNIWADSWALKD